MKERQASGGRFYPVDEPAHAPARYGDYAPIPKVYRLDLGSARTNEKMGIGGSFIWAYKASGTGVSVDLKFNSQQADNMTFYVGTSLSGLKFSEVFVTHAAQAGGWIDFFVVDQGQNIRSLNPANVFTAVTITKPGDFATLADVTVTAAAAAAIVAAANATRKEIIIQSDPANTQEIRIGDSNTAAARGIVLEVGSTLILETTDVIYAYTGAGADQTLHIAYTGD